MATQTQDKLQRHAGIDRLFHWVTAVTMTLLLATSLLPIVGIRFPWVKIHWVSGLVLTLVVLFHILRAITVQKLSVIQLKGADLAEFSGKKPGKYSLPQKAMHLAWMLTILVAIATGIVMMVKAGTPVFHRNPYILTVKAWGILTLLHDLAALAALFLILVHVYFGLLPEKRMYLRSMVGGWMSRSELALNHDPERVARGE